MLLDVNPVTGSLKFNVGAVRDQTRGVGRRGAGYRVSGNLPAISPRMLRSKKHREAQEKFDDNLVELLQQQKHTCVLKVIHDQEGLTLDAVGEILSITRERVRQIQTIATDKIAAEPGTFADC